MARSVEKTAKSRVDAKGLIRQDLLKLEAYQAITLPGTMSDDASVSLSEAIKLDGNENPYGCSPRVQKALSACQTYHLYPDTEQLELREALSGYTGLDPRYLIAGAGSDELIDLLLRLTLEPGDKVINCVPTFGMYKFSTEVCGGKVIEVPRTADYGIDVKGIIDAVDSKTKLVFVASPNNPSGNATSKSDILRLLETGALIVVDEAYFEFCGKTIIGKVPQYGNLVVLRTFSKWAGLAGLRVGYGAFPEKLAKPLMLIKPPYTPNAAANVAALESLRDVDYLRGTVKAILKERERLFEELKALPFIEPVPSEANFILCRVKKGDAKSIQRSLRNRGIFVRYFNTPRLKDFIRISVGKPEHTDRLLDSLSAVERENG